MGLFNWFSSKKNISDDNTSGSERLEEKQELVTGEKEFVIPKSLPEAVKMIAEERGSNFLCERAFINMLNDYNLLKDIPALKNVFRNMQDEGYIGKMLSLTNWELESRSLCAQYIKDFGAKESIVAYIVSCVGYGLNKVTELPVYVEQTGQRQVSNTAFNEPATQTISIDIDTDEATAKKSTTATPTQQPLPTQPFDPKQDLPYFHWPTVSLFSNIPETLGVLGIRDTLSSPEFQNCTEELPIALGTDKNGKTFVFDLAKMPHILVAGTTGKGKSVALHGMIASLLFKKHPSELKFSLIDTKGLEFGFYEKLTNSYLVSTDLLSDEKCIVNDLSDIGARMAALIREVEKRTELLKKARARNIVSYNQMFCSRQLDPTDGHYYMPYIVAIIDDFGNIMQQDARLMELWMTNLTQTGALVGIHLIICTQLTTKEIVSPAIRAQFPSRIAFSLLSMSESRLILGTGTANKISTPGECIYMYNGNQYHIRCGFISDEEIRTIVNHIAVQADYGFPYTLPEEESEFSREVDMNHLDPLFDDAARLIVINQSGSTSLIQRKFVIGYNRAGRLMDQLEKAGIVGPAKGSAPRAVLIQDEMRLNKLLNALR